MTNIRYRCITIIILIIFNINIDCLAQKDAYFYIALGHTKILPTANVHKLVIGNPQIIQAKLLDSNQVLVNGIKVGKTNLIFLGPNIRKEMIIEVSNWSLQDVQDYCRYLLQEELNIVKVNEQVFVTGKTHEDSEALEKLLKSRFPGIAVRLSQYQEQLNIAKIEEMLQNIFQNQTLIINQLGSDSYILRGRLANSEERTRLTKIIELFPGRIVNLVDLPQNSQNASGPEETIKAFSEVLNSIWPNQLTCTLRDDLIIIRGILSEKDYRQYQDVLGLYSKIKVISLVDKQQSTFQDEYSNKQISVKLHLVELNREDLQELGFDWDKSISWAADNAGSGPLQIGNWVRQNDLVSRLRLLSSHGRIKILAEPELITLDNQEATVHVGGEIPVGNEESGVEWKRYGIHLTITPKVVGNQDIILSIQTEVSSLDWTNGIEINKASLPAITTSSFTTTLCQPPGTSSALGGLLEKKNTVTTTGVPGLNSLPLVGGLFSWDKNESSERELVAVVSVDFIGPGGNQFDEFKGEIESGENCTGKEPVNFSLQ